MSIPQEVWERNKREYKDKATIPLDMGVVKKRQERDKKDALNKRLDNICEVCGYMCEEGEKVEVVMYDAWTCRECAGKK